MTTARFCGVAVRLLIATALFGAVSGFAPVAPKHQRLREIQAVAKRAADLLPDPIEAIEAVEPDLYRIRSERCSMEVRIRDARPAARSVHIPGRRRFRVAAGSPDCR